MGEMTALMIVPLIVWAGVFVYLVHLDAKVKRLRG